MGVFEKKLTFFSIFGFFVKEFGKGFFAQDLLSVLGGFPKKTRYDFQKLIFSICVHDLLRTYKKSFVD